MTRRTLDPRFSMNLVPDVPPDRGARSDGDTVPQEAPVGGAVESGTPGHDAQPHSGVVSAADVWLYSIGWW